MIRVLATLAVAPITITAAEEAEEDTVVVETVADTVVVETVEEEEIAEAEAEDADTTPLETNYFVKYLCCNSDFIIFNSFVYYNSLMILPVLKIKHYIFYYYQYSRLGAVVILRSQ